MRVNLVKGEKGSMKNGTCIGKSRVLAVILTLMIASLSLVKPTTIRASEINGSEEASVSEIVPNLIEKKEDLEIVNEGDEYTFEEGTKEAVYKVAIKKRGALNITLSEVDSNFSYISATLYEDSACTKRVAYGVTLFKDELVKTKTANVSKPGTYYMKFELSRSSYATGNVTFSLNLDLVSSSDRVISPKQGYVAYQDYDSDKIIYKITVQNEGLITFQLTPNEKDTGASVKYQLLNSKKKAISENEYVYSTKLKDGTYGSNVKYYTVTKGTYYIQVDTSCGLYNFNYTFSGVADKAGVSKEKATAIKVGGAAVKALCTATDKTSKVDWFKFTLPKEKAVKITIASKNDGKLQLEICDSKGKTLWYGSKTLYEGSETVTLESDGKFSKGTYYIKVYKKNVTSSGSYNIKVK